MPMAGFLHGGSGAVSLRPARGPYNLFPAIADALPRALSDIVAEVTKLIGEEAAATAPVAERRRGPSDPEPGTLRDSVKVEVIAPKGEGDIATGRVDFTATSPSGHPYALEVETGTVFTAAQPFLVPAVQKGTVEFESLAGNLESRLPR